MRKFIILALLLPLTQSSEAQDIQYDFAQLIKLIFVKNKVQKNPYVISDLKNPDLIILKNDVVAQVTGNILIMELIAESPRTFVLDDDYIFAYTVKNYLEFTEITFQDKHAILRFQIGPNPSESQKYTFKFIKGRRHWRLKD